MWVKRSTVIFGRSELVSKLGVSLDLDESSASHTTKETGVYTTYRLRGSWILRDLALATGSNDFTTSSGTDAVKEDASSSSSWSDSRLAGASSEALRRPTKA